MRNGIYYCLSCWIWKEYLDARVVENKQKTDFKIEVDSLLWNKTTNKYIFIWNSNASRKLIAFGNSNHLTI